MGNNLVIFKTVRGMRDFLPLEAERMRYIENIARETASLYGYDEIITPVLESYELLSAKAGEELRQRMYTFKDLGGRKVALRPEFTASIARLVATTMRNYPKPIRLFCVGSLYRYDEPQYGRYREFWQSNYELIGSNKPEADMEILELTNHLITQIGLKNYKFKIGHVGIIRGILAQEEIKEEDQSHIIHLLDKKEWDAALQALKQLNTPQKCIETIKKLIETRGEEPDKIVETIRAHVKGYEAATEALENLTQILSLIKAAKINFKMSIEAGFARGLEYYTGMIFEIFVPELKIAIGGGGRYDRLIQLFGGEPAPAVGVAHGIDRMALAMEKQKTPLKTRKKKKTLVIPLKEELKTKAIEVTLLLRKAGIPTEPEIMGRTVTRALQDADRRNVGYAVLIAPREMKENKIVLRNLKKREQYVLTIKEAVKKILINLSS